MAKIQWSLTAEEDLHEIELFTARDFIYYAIHFVDRMIDEEPPVSGEAMIVLVMINLMSRRPATSKQE